MKEAGTPEHIAVRIVEGRLNKWYKDVVLMEQPFVKGDDQTIRDVLTAAIAKIGENIKIRRFVRWTVGEGLEKRSDDFAAEVLGAAGLQ